MVGANGTAKAKLHCCLGQAILAKDLHIWHMCAKNFKEALAIDEETGSDFRRKALGKEMTKVKAAWKSADGVTPEQARTGKEPSMIVFQEI